MKANNGKALRNTMRAIKLGLAGVALLAAAGQAGATVITETEPNDSFATAQNIDAFFSLDFSGDIGDTTVNTSTIIPHVTIQGTGNSTYDYYAFSTLGGRAIFDIDVFGLNSSGGLSDSYLHLFNFAGTSIATNDDNFASYGQAGSAEHYGIGSNFSLDSYIETTLTSGNYFIRVGSCCESPANSGTYTLQVSVENHIDPIPEPGSLALLGLGMTGLAFVRRRKAAR